MTFVKPPQPAIVTIVSNNYLHFARTMLRSAKQHHPDYKLYCVIVDRDLSHASALSSEFCAIPIDKLNLPLGEEFLFQYNILELNTAVKPWTIEYLMAQGHHKVIYVDPDIFFYSRMVDVEKMLSANADIVLTPHLLAPVTDEKQPRELDIRRAGTFNLGFCALRDSTNTRNFLRWWQSKLTRDCVVDMDRGLFVDQSWIDLVPGLFDKVGILRHQGYNVAYWNIAQRHLVKSDENKLFVNDEPLVFFHFSGLDPAKPETFSKYQDRYTLATVGLAKKLIDDYVKVVKENGHRRYARLRYAFGYFSNGEPIPDIFRMLYRRSNVLRERMGLRPIGTTLSSLSKPDLFRSPEEVQPTPGASSIKIADLLDSSVLLPEYTQRTAMPLAPGPFACVSALCDWWREISIEGVSPTNSMIALWNERRDVQSQFPMTSAHSIKDYYRWFIKNPLPAQHYSASVILHHAEVVKHIDEETKTVAEKSPAVQRNVWPGNEDRANCLYAHLLNRAPDKGGFAYYSDLCRTDTGFARAWAEIGLSPESRKKRFLWLRMLKALLISLYTEQKYSKECVNYGVFETNKLKAHPFAGAFPAEADATTHGVWVTDKIVVQIALRSDDRIRLEGLYFADLIAMQTGNGESTIRFLLGSEEVYSTKLSAHGSFGIEFIAPAAFCDRDLQLLVIESNKTFVPKNIGRSIDARKLAWRMMRLYVGSKSVFDCKKLGEYTDQI